MDGFLAWLEATPLSVWTREEPSIFAFPSILVAHAIGMGLAVGVNMAVAIHLLGAGPGIATRELKRYVPVMWFGFWLNAVSGVWLLIAYPTKGLTNPVFWLKLFLIAVGMRIFVVFSRTLFQDAATTGAIAAPPGRLRRLAVASLACWIGAITAGRLLAYTYRKLLAGW